MDVKLWLLVVAACVSSSYRNSVKLPETYTNDLARPLGRERNERSFSVPQFIHGYKEIRKGKVAFPI